MEGRWYLGVAGFAVAAAFFTRRAFNGTTKWTPSSIDLTGRSFLVTGGNTGLGFATADHLLQLGAAVILTSRSHAKGEAAVKRLNSDRVSMELLDLADLDDVAACALRLCDRGVALDGLVLNAGVMVPPYGTTKQGYELQFGVNHLGHYAFTVGLLNGGALKEVARIVVVSSSGANNSPTPIDFEAISVLPKEAYGMGWQQYGRSKMANMLFAEGLRQRVNGGVTVTTSHPGFTATDLQRSSAVAALARFLSMSPARGSLTCIRALVEDDQVVRKLGPRDRFAPDGLGGMVGNPTISKNDVPDYAGNQKAVDALWKFSAKATGLDLK